MRGHLIIAVLCHPIAFAFAGQIHKRLVHPVRNCTEIYAGNAWTWRLKCSKVNNLLGPIDAVNPIRFRSICSRPDRSSNPAPRLRGRGPGSEGRRQHRNPCGRKAQIRNRQDTRCLRTIRSRQVMSVRFDSAAIFAAANVSRRSAITLLRHANQGRRQTRRSPRGRAPFHP